MKTNIASTSRSRRSELAGELVHDWILLGVTGEDSLEKPILLNVHGANDDRLNVFRGTRTEAYSEADRQAMAWESRGGALIAMLRVVPTNLGLVLAGMIKGSVCTEAGVAV